MNERKNLNTKQIIRQYLQKEVIEVTDPKQHQDPDPEHHQDPDPDQESNIIVEIEIGREREREREILKFRVKEIVIQMEQQQHHRQGSY